MLYYSLIYIFTCYDNQSHTSVVDKNGMAVALTSTVNLVFGSQVLDPETGILLNDEMDDFSIPDVPNQFGLYPSPCRLSTYDMLQPNSLFFIQIISRSPESDLCRQRHLQLSSTKMGLSTSPLAARVALAYSRLSSKCC